MANICSHTMLRVSSKRKFGLRLKSPIPVLQRCRDFRPSPRYRGLATITDFAQQSPTQGEDVHFQPGQKYHGFTLVRVKHVPELQLKAFHLEHDKTGAEYLHVARDDNNNVFSIGFKTNPPDDTGVPHILEHTTLCGSEKYSTSMIVTQA